MRREKKKIYGSTTRASFHVIYETKGGITIPGRSPCSLQPPRWVGDSRSFRSTASHTFTRLSTHAPRRSWACFICKQQAVLVCTFLHLFFLLPFLFFLSLYIYIYGYSFENTRCKLYILIIDHTRSIMSYNISCYTILLFYC